MRTLILILALLIITKMSFTQNLKLSRRIKFIAINTHSINTISSNMIYSVTNKQNVPKKHKFSNSNISRICFFDSVGSIKFIYHPSVIDTSYSNTPIECMHYPKHLYYYLFYVKRAIC